MIRKTLAVLAGLFVGALALGLISLYGDGFHPKPQNLNTEDFFGKIAHAGKAPLIAQLWSVFACAIGAIIAGSVATSIAQDKKRICALVCASVFLIYTISDLIIYPQPLLIWVLAIVVWYPMALFGYWLVMKKVF